MNEFDISYDGYSPQTGRTSHEPYRPPVSPGYRGPHPSGTPYRPPVDDEQDSDFTPIEPEQPKVRKTEAETQPKPEAETHRQSKPVDEVLKGAQRTASTPEENESERQREREASARERQQKRNRRLEELRRQERNSRPFAGMINFFTDERTRMFLAAVLMIGSIFVVIAVFSHFGHAEQDQSAVINLPQSEIAQQPGLVGNAAGGFGAWLSYLLMCDALGLGSLMLIPYMWALALSLIEVRRCKFWATTFRCLLLAITISIVLGLVTYTWDTVIYWGGNHGHYINKYLLDHATWIGAIAVSGILVAAVCCVYLNELKVAYNKWHAAYQRHKLQEELRRERRRELERLEREAEEERRAEEARQRAEARARAEEPRTEDRKTEEREHRTEDPEQTTEGREQRAEDREQRTEDRKTEDRRTEDRDTEGTTVVTIDNKKSEETVVTPDKTEDEEPAVFTIDRKPKNTTTQLAENFTLQANTVEEADPNLPLAETVDTGVYDHRAELPNYQLPTLELLEDRPSGPVIDMEEQQANKALIEKVLLDYKIPISRIMATVGPTVTLYEIVPAEGVRISQIKRLEDDIALNLKALGIRIIAPIPGKGTVGIEVPNKDPKTVSMRSVINSKKYQECKMALPMAMGATISNEIFIADMAKMPHLLVAGATGMGKSVGLNVIIASLLYKKHPSELKFVLIDPKMVEFSLYSRLERYYLAKLPNEEDAIITDMKKVIQTLSSLCVEMDMRYELLRDANVRALEEYNKKFTERRLNPENGHRYLPYIVVIVDEFADLIMTQGKEVEQPIARIAQKARAVGIHMILATQRPSTNVITGLIKANFPGRIAFRVIQMVDSRTILDCPGANQLIGRGDMLFSNNGIMERVQCAFISTEEVEALVNHIDHQASYEHAYYLPEYVPEEGEGGGGGIAGGSMERDALFNEAARFVVTRQLGSTSSLQRQFGIGYNRAGKLMDQMEAAGIVGPVNGAKPRAILMDIVTLESILGD